METAVMGKVIVTAKIENVGDLYSVHKGTITTDQVRRLEVTDALVDAGATTLSMPKRLITQLGLFPCRKPQTYAAAYLVVQGHECTCDVTEVSDDSPVLIGRIALAALDLVVDWKGRRLIGNPEHGGEQMAELYGIL